MFVGQPNLSRAIKELEGSLGVSIFERSAHGMELTPEGGVFLRYAKAILEQVDEVEHMFTKGSAQKEAFLDFGAALQLYLGGVCPLFLRIACR